MSYVEVSPAIPLHPKKSQVYTYSSGEEALLGQRVSIPFGPKKLTGVILKIHNKKPRFTVKGATLKKEFLSEKQITFATELANLLHAGLGYTLRFFPPTTTPHASLLTSPTTPQALTIIPEKWMTNRFKETKSTIFITADLTPVKLKQAATKIASGKITEIIGTQKALFLPFNNLRKITIHEPELSSHKSWDQFPRLDNRRGAKMLAEIWGIEAKKLAGDGAGGPPGDAQRERASTRGSAPAGPVINAFSPADYKQKNPVPLEFSRRFLKLHNKNKTVLLFANIASIETKTAKALKVFRYELHKKNIHVKHFDAKTIRELKKSDKKFSPLDAQAIMGSSALFSLIQGYKFDHVIWLFPELSLMYPSHNTIQNALELYARLSSLSKNPLELVTRNANRIDKIFGDIRKTQDRDNKLRKKYNYPPYSELALLSFTGKTEKQAINKAKKSEAGRVFLPLKQTKKDEFTAHVLLKTDPKKIKQAINKANPDFVELDPGSVV